MRSRKVELDKNSILLMSATFIGLPNMLNKLTKETLGKYKLFSFPFDTRVLQLHGSHKDFKGVKLDDIDRHVNRFPVSHVKFVTAQKIKAEHFNRIAKFQWVGAIFAEIDGHIK